MQFWIHKNYALELYQPEMIESRINYINENSIWAGIVGKTRRLYVFKCQKFCWVRRFKGRGLLVILSIFQLEIGNDR
jgi:hypothetical protein